MIYWPPGFPDPQFGNASTTAEHRLQSEAEVAPRQRVIDPNYRQTLSVSWTMTEAQFRAFESWHEYRIYDGISWFGMAWTGAGRPGTVYRQCLCPAERGAMAAQRRGRD